MYPPGTLTTPGPFLTTAGRYRGIQQAIAATAYSNLYAFGYCLCVKQLKFTSESERWRLGSSHYNIYRLMRSKSYYWDLGCIGYHTQLQPLPLVQPILQKKEDMKKI